MLAVGIGLLVPVINPLASDYCVQFHGLTYIDRKPCGIYSVAVTTMKSFSSKRKQSHISPLITLATALAIALFVKTFIIDLAVISGDSMKPVLVRGNIVMILRCAFGLVLPNHQGYLVRWAEPRPGQTVAIISPSGSVVKRILAVGPDELVFIGGRLVTSDGSYVPYETKDPLSSGILVEEGRIFVVGTNPFESSDSRNYGTLPIENVLGIVLPF